MHIIIYDASCGFLSRLWRLGAWFFLVRGWADRVHSVQSWDELISVVGGYSRVESIQVWSHGTLDRHNGAPDGPCIAKKHLRDDDFQRLCRLLATCALNMQRAPLFYWRCCSVFVGVYGKEFAERFARASSFHVAGHTYNIGWRWGWQSGLHILAPGAKADWPTSEGQYGDGRLMWSESQAPNTIWCLSRGPVEQRETLKV